MSEPTKKVAADGHEYHVSKNANADVAPTNAVSIASASRTVGLSSDQAEFVTLMDYEWNLKTNFNKEYICEEYGFSEDEWKAFTTNPAVISNLLERGIHPKFYVSAPKQLKSKLTPLQLALANSMLDLNDPRPIRKKLQDAGVTTYQYNAWQRDDEFKAYMQQRAEDLLGDVQHEVLLALTDRAIGGDTKSIELYLELTGRYTRASATNQGASAEQMQVLVMRIIEIIIDEVHDPEVAARIADKLKGLTVGASISGMMPAPSAVVPPPVAKPREITPKIKAMMESGVGMDN
jgi:hypothetical protein